MAKAAAGTRTKLDVVREILEQGIVKAADIVAAAKAQGVEISQATAANYKHQLGKTRPTKRTKGVTRKKVARVIRDESTGTVATTSLELENLALRLIIKAGSVEKARQLIDKMG